MSGPENSTDKSYGVYHEESPSQLNGLDLAQIKDPELRRKIILTRLENQDQKEDAQRYMAWFALVGMVFLPLVVVGASALGLETGSKNVADLAPTYFIAVAGIVAAFYGKEAYMSKR